MHDFFSGWHAVCSFAVKSRYAKGFSHFFIHVVSSVMVFVNFVLLVMFLEPLDKCSPVGPVQERTSSPFCSTYAFLDVSGFGWLYVWVAQCWISWFFFSMWKRAWDHPLLTCAACSCYLSIFHWQCYGETWFCWPSVAAACGGAAFPHSLLGGRSAGYLFVLPLSEWKAWICRYSSFFAFFCWAALLILFVLELQRMPWRHNVPVWVGDGPSDLETLLSHWYFVGFTL